MQWSEYFLNIAKEVSKKSKDPSTKVGCIIADKSNTVKALGFNGFPHGVNDLESRYEDRELKYKLVCHAEANAISQAAKCGVSTNHCIMYLTHPPCSSCAKLIIQAGIEKVVSEKPSDYLMERWKEDFKISDLMFQESNVELELYNRE